ncbi:trypsin-like peptidase domain-containing protein [Ruminococcus sp.]|uniref:S1C family serine protease n=1 Tax=Ruminococcus sp. TaxID=41978 RepID=UPI0025D88DFE|nr:trypsin-like peptidase domain-containing protein [Ruminococcus sp.]MCR4638199.1 trypsin-like peptidase domain-containing protein [Ruminococcus sp.]
MDGNNNYNNSPYGSNYQQPYVPQHEKPSSESSFNSGMQGVNEPNSYNSPPPPPQNNYGQQNGYNQPTGGYSQPNNYGPQRGYNNQYGSAPRQGGYGQQQGYSGYDQQPRRPVYDRFMYEPIGFPETDRGQNSSNEFGFAEKKSRPTSERAIAALFLILILIAAGISIIGIIHDIAKSGEIVDKIGNPQQVVLYKESKPKGANDEEKFKDENGRYTTEGAAALVKPSIVKIYTYADYAGYMAKRTVGTGSGIVLNEDGYIVTNAHVLQSDGYHKVETVDGDLYDAKIVGRDAKTDIAVVKVNAKDLTPATLGNSDEAVVGEQVIAIGNPANLSNTVTDGIVSAVNRKIRSDSTGFEMNCIQTNADISPGNSGGALVNMYGQVIGITSSKYVSAEFEGLGFAITINEASPVIEELIKNGFVAGRFRIGIKLRDTETEEKKKALEEILGFELPDDFKGIYIDSIDKDSDIANTELKAGDFITEINGKTVSTYDELYDTISSQYEAGDTVPATCAHLDKNGKIDYYNIEFKLMEDTSGNY